jgi:hypothetical protein
MSRAFDSKELREMLVSHKDWPVVFLVDSDVVGDDCWNWYAGGYSCKEGEVLDCEQDINPERIYSDREDFREDVEEYICNNTEEELTDKELTVWADAICRKYEPYWKKAILLYVMA